MIETDVKRMPAHAIARLPRPAIRPITAPCNTFLMG